MIPHPVLETARLRRRPPRIEDAQAVFQRYARDPAVSTYMPWSAHESLAQTEDYLRASPPRATAPAATGSSPAQPTTR